ncbi:MAG: ABC transporter permease [Candidatus Aminicenantes bacterium]|nr:ABC transporter permease [Candidatus Aminicenantes bacterium]
MKPPRTYSALRTAGLVARHDLRLSLQGGRSALFFVGVPVLLILLVGLGARGFSERMQLEVRVDVVDRDASAASRAFAAALAAANEALVVRAAPPPESAPEGPARDAPHALLTIPEGFAAALETGATTTVTFQSGAGLAAPAIAFAAVRTAATRLGGPYVAARLSADFAAAHDLEAGPEFFAERLAAARDAWSRPPVLVRTAKTGPNAKATFGAQWMENGFKLSVPSITVIFVMISILGMMQSLAEERAAGLLRRVGSLPVTNAMFLGGKLAATFLLGWAQFVVLIVFGEAFGVGLGGAPLAAAAVAAAYALAVTALALALSSVARTPGQASAVATAAWVVLTMLGGGWWPLIVVPPWMRTLGHISPVAWCLDALNALIIGRGSGTDVLLPAGALVLFAAAFFVIGVKALDLHTAGGGRAKTPALFGLRTLDAE